MSEQYIRVASVQDIKPGKLGCVEAAGRRLLLANVDGEFFATDDMCTHEDASLSTGALHGDCVSCPLHGSRFNVRTGEPQEEPAEIPLQTYPVKIDGDAVLVAVPAEATS